MGPGSTSAVGRRYHLRELLGQGACGSVYLAELESPTGFRRRVAVKVVAGGVRSPLELGRRLRDEARVLGCLAHRHVVGVLDLAELDGRPAIVMEYVPGADLAQVLEALARAGRTFPAPAALEVAAAVLDALDAAGGADDGEGHALHLVHRDVKPGNVRLTPEGEVKVLDFGVARFEHAGREAHTRVPGAIGTEAYMAPERILGEADTAAGDVYAAASTLLELLTGRPLGRTPILPDRHERYVVAALDRLRRELRGEPAVVDAVAACVAAGLAFDPTSRPAARDLSEQLDALSRCLPGEGLRPFARRFVPEVDARLGRRPQPTTGVLSEGTVGSSPTILPDEEPPRTSRAIRFAAVVGVVAAAGVAASFARSVPAPPPIPDAPVVAIVELPEPTPFAPPPAPIRRARPRPARAPIVEAPPPPIVDRAQVALKDGSGLRITCGGVVAEGTASVRITSFPAGPCTVEATWLGEPYTATITIDQPRGYQCRVEGGSLRCT